MHNIINMHFCLSRFVYLAGVHNEEWKGRGEGVQSIYTVNQILPMLHVLLKIGIIARYRILMSDMTKDLNSVPQAS